MTQRVDTRLAAGAGLVSIILGSVAGVVDRMWDMPATGSSAAEIAAQVGADRTALLVAMVMNTTAITLWLVFGAGVWALLRGRDNSGFLSTCFAAGLVTFVTLLFAGFTSFFVLVYRDGAVGDARTLYDLAFGLLAMSGPPTAVALGAYAAFVYRTGDLPRWTASLAVVAAVTHVVLLASLVVTEGFFSLEGEVVIAIPLTLFAWIAGTSVALLADRSLVSPTIEP